MSREYICVGKFNKSILQKCDKNIMDEYVILTNERKKHIVSRHIEIYDEVMRNINNAIYYPDYILEDIKNKDTLLIVKKIKDKNNNFIIVVKLNTIQSNINKHNSILTFWKIRDRNLKSQLKKHKLIYQKNIMDNVE